MSRTKTPKQTARAFVAVDSRGNFAWGTVRPTPEGCAQIVEHWNPACEFAIMPIQIAYDPTRRLVTQLRLELAPSDDPDWLATKNGDWQEVTE